MGCFTFIGLMLFLYAMAVLGTYIWSIVKPDGPGTMIFKALITPFTVFSKKPEPPDEPPTT